MTISELTESGESWLVPSVGGVVTQCRVDHAFTLIVMDDGQRTSNIVFEQPFVLETETIATPLDPGADPALLAPALSVFGQRISDIVAFKSGDLEVRVGGGIRLTAQPTMKFEAWNLTNTDGLRIVSLPGGALSIWTPDT